MGQVFGNFRVLNVPEYLVIDTGLVFAHEPTKGFGLAVLGACDEMEIARFSVFAQSQKGWVLDATLEVQKRVFQLESSLCLWVLLMFAMRLNRLRITGVIGMPRRASGIMISRGTPAVRPGIRATLATRTWIGIGFRFGFGGWNVYRRRGWNVYRVRLFVRSCSANH